MFHLFLESFDALRVSLHFHGNEMNLTLSFLGKSDKLVIGQHLLLSPLSTVVKPACSEFDHRPNPIQAAVSQCSMMYHKSTSCSACGRTSV